jgi:phage terminase large subunit
VTAPRELNFFELAGFFQKQLEALDVVESRRFTLYGGAAGPGKSYWLRWTLLYLLLQYTVEFNLRGVRVGLFSLDYPTLKDRQLSKIKFEFPSWLGDYSITDHEFTLKSQYGSGVLALRNLDDPSKYKSAEFAAVGVEELTENKVDVFHFLRTRLRWPGIPTGRTRFLAATNPGSVGHGWVKKLWIDRKYEAREKEADQFAFVKALPRDNPHLDETYYQGLEGLPEKLRKALLEGNWDIFEGQVFTEWNEAVHVVNPAEWPVLPSYDRFLCFDFGYSAAPGNAGALYWVAPDYDGNLIVYRELYGPGRTYEDWAEEAKRLSGHDEESMRLGRRPEPIKYMVAGLDAFVKRPTDRKTFRSGVDAMRQIWNIPYEEAYVDRPQGLIEFHERLKIDASTGRPRLVFYPECVNAIRTIPSLVHDEHRVEDVDTDLEDHPYDAIRYGIMSRRVRKSQKPLTGVEAKLKAWKDQDTLTPANFNKFYSNKR